MLRYPKRNISHNGMMASLPIRVVTPAIWRHATQPVVSARSYQAAPFPEREPTDRPQNLDYSEGNPRDWRRAKRKQNSSYSHPRFKVPNISDQTTVSEQALKMELMWVQDRVALARRVDELLRKNDYDKARELVRAAEANHIDCIAGWNLLYEFLMDHNKPMVAFKLYNEMKKRGRKPNERTYTIMFRGFADSTSTNAIPAALKIYRSLCKPTSEVEPSTIHHNALLEVCARHGNMEELWQAVDQLPESGAGAPDARTYTIILNAMRAGVDQETAKMNSWSQKEGITIKRKETLVEAKKVWSIVVAQLQKGKLAFDSRLIAAMGKTLLTGDEKDAWDVFRLFNQTTGLPLPSARVNRSLMHENAELRNASEVTKSDDLFAPLDQWKISKNVEVSVGEKVKSIHANLGNPGLSLLMETCLELPPGLGISIGKFYWDILTNPKGAYKVVPDSAAFHDYLRLCRVGRSSRETYRAIVQAKEQAPEVLQLKTFIIAISTCERDKNNPNVFMIAGKLLELMDQTQRVPEPKVLIRYVDLIEHLTTDERLRTRLEFERSKPEKTSFKFTRDEKVLFKFTHTEAIRLLRPHTTRIKQMLAYGKIFNQRPSSRLGLDDSLEEIEGENDDAVEERAIQNLESDKIPRGCKLDVDQALETLVRVRRLHLTVLNPQLVDLSKSATRWYKQESERLRRFAFARRSPQKPHAKIASMEEEERDARLKKAANRNLGID